MSDSTGISWTDATWNPIRGCSRVSDGCRHCYAERVAARFSGPGQPYEGLARHKLTIANNEDRDPGNRSEARWTGEVRFVAEHLADPLRWRKPRRIFVNSMSDLFHEKLTNDQIAAVFGVMAAAPQHTFQVLTKRAKRMREWFAWLADRVEVDAEDWSGRECGVTIDAARDACVLEYLDETACGALAGHLDLCHLGLTTSKAIRWPLPNVWLGVSVENQDAADERIPDLIATPAAVRLLSCEPLLDEIDLDVPRCDDTNHGEAEWSDSEGTPWCNECESERSYGHWLRCDGGIDWVIAGCESGPGARPCEVEWLRSLRDQCAATEVPFFLKQAVEVEGAMTEVPPPTPLEDQPGYSPRVGPFIPTIGFGHGSKRKREGVIELPYLDGVQHANFPEVRR